MKESYFTTENIASASKEMLAELFPKGQPRARTFLPEKAALLALDLQEYFLISESHAFVPSATAVVPIIAHVAEEFHQRGRPIFYTQHLNSDRDAGSLKRWWRDLITVNHPHKALTGGLDLKIGHVIAKTQYDAFYQTDLESLLKEQGAEQVLISGVMTHLCCETTARSAFVRGFEVFFLVDGTATYSRDFHLATLRNLGHGFATLVTSDQIESVFRERT